MFQTKMTDFLLVTILCTHFVTRVTCLSSNETEEEVNKAMPTTGGAGEEEELLDHLFTKYNNVARPTLGAVNVTVRYALENILNLDESSQLLNAFGYIAMIWIDRRLAWNSSMFGGLQQIIVPAEKVWRPDIIVRNSVDQIYGDILDPEKFRVIISRRGQIMFIVAGKTSTTCILDVTYFPFDAQACYIHLDSFKYASNQVKLHTVPRDNVTMLVFRQNSQWSYVAYETKSGEEGGYSAVMFIIHIKRKPTFFVLTLVVPCISTAMLLILVFILPAESGDKISLQVTLVLSQSVFQIVLAGHLPTTSDFTPVFSMYIAATIEIAICSLFCTALVVYLHHQSTAPLPRIFRTETFLCLADLIGVSKSRNHGQTAISRSSLNNADAEYEVKPTSDESNTSEEWGHVARVFDRMFLIGFSFVIVVGTFVVLLVLVYKSPSISRPIAYQNEITTWQDE